MRLDHIGIPVNDLARSAAFYEQLLGPMGLRRQAEVGGWLGFGGAEGPDFWIGPGEAHPMHLAFRANSRAEVDDFHATALRAGAKDRDGPRLRPEYHPNFYSAMVYDPDGHNLELVCHLAET